MASAHDLKVWYQPEQPDKAEVDIVFVHGLRGGRESTWTKEEVLWPSELLKVDIKNSRIIGFGYDSGITDRPIVTVGHSLGGLVLAQVMYGGDQAGSGDSIHAISSKIIGMLFLGTPFYGSPSATWAESFRRVLGLVLKDTDQNTLKALAPDSQLLKSLRDGFPEAIRKRNESDAKVKVRFCFEKWKTQGILVVPEDNAKYPGVGGPAIPIEANHINICKFANEEDPNYKKVKKLIVDLMAPAATAEEAKGGDNISFVNHGHVANNVMKGNMPIENQVFNYGPLGKERNDEEEDEG
ncbi:hypothetical protein EK21DRAFT_84144 [Setomelanomma holmii]|uniref:Uncharacterized protein n=1 Tax=Setomelanomma holmii TaxID=210430 RepID=A0A9P4HJW6_9PLEO|nr:hypothetical protein EK21DRAFT_84144 [Setomelanomma holmii]